MPLTLQKKQFIALLTQGLSHSELIDEAYQSDGNARTVATEAYRLVQRPQIAGLITGQREAARLKDLISQLQQLKRLR